MGYDEVAMACEELGYRDKLRLAQLLIQLARKEEENQNPQARSKVKNIKATKKGGKSENKNDTIEYVVERLFKLKPSKKKALVNSVRAMFQFQGGISESDEEKIIKDLQKNNYIQIDSNNRVTYL